MSSHNQQMDRRDFLKGTAAGVGAAAIGASALRAAETAASAGKAEPKDAIWLNRQPDMQYRRLGRTNFMVSRVVQGFAGDESLWRKVLAKGVNYWDTARGYGNMEVELAPFLKKNRDKIWLTSKATDVAGYSKIDPTVSAMYVEAMKKYLGDGFDKVGTPQGRRGNMDLLPLHKAAVEKQKATGEKPDLRPIGAKIAELYSTKLEESLKRLETDHVDAYFVHGIEIPWIFDCVELWEAFEKAKKAGKAKHFGFSTHTHQKEVLAAAAVANDKGPFKIDLIMPGVNPLSFDEWRTELDALKKQEVGIVAMKTTGIKNRPVDGKTEKLNKLMGGKEYNEWERSKLYMLHLTDGVIDAVIAAIKTLDQMDKDLQLPGVQMNAEAMRELKALVRLEMAGACHLCGDCTSSCPEHIAVADMIRYHAYVTQYDEKQMARDLYQQAGYDPAKVCNNCGKCADVCASNVPITQLLHQLSVHMA